jgi:short-subunit dehydrogenase
LASELAKSGVSVLTVVPGLMRTGSFLNAEFAGQPEKEYQWFTVLSSLPLVTVGAERASKRILRAALGGESVLTLSLSANVATRFEGLFPGILVRALSLQNRVMAGAAASGRHESGRSVHSRAGHGIVGRLSTLGRKAAARLQPPA